MTIAAILLAAGRSRRFGDADKIATDLDGVPLGMHAARALAAIPVDARFVVARSANLVWPGFEIVANDRPDAGLSRSIALGVAAARGADGVLIALADMPFVPAEHFLRLLERWSGFATLVSSSDGERRMPPALFGSAWFAELRALAGDRGAGALLERGDAVRAAPDQLIDIDRPADLAMARMLLNSAAGRVAR